MSLTLEQLSILSHTCKTSIQDTNTFHIFCKLKISRQHGNRRFSGDNEAERGGSRGGTAAGALAADVQPRPAPTTPRLRNLPLLQEYTSFVAGKHGGGAEEVPSPSAGGLLPVRRRNGGERARRAGDSVQQPRRGFCACLCGC